MATKRGMLTLITRTKAFLVHVVTNLKPNEEKIGTALGALLCGPFNLKGTIGC